MGGDARGLKHSSNLLCFRFARLLGELSSDPVHVVRYCGLSCLGADGHHCLVGDVYLHWAWRCRWVPARGMDRRSAGYVGHGLVLRGEYIVAVHEEVRNEVA